MPPRKVPAKAVTKPENDENIKYFTDLFYRDRAEYVLEHLDEINQQKVIDVPQTTKNLNEYVARSKFVCDSLEGPIHSVRVAYHQIGELKVGRYYAMQYGLQRMEKIIRETIIGDLYVDYDSVNSGPTIIKNICQGHKIPEKDWDMLDSYVERRNQCLEIIYKENPDKYNGTEEFNKALAKKDVNAKIYDVSDVPMNTPSENADWVKRFHYQMNELSRKIAIKYVHSGKFGDFCKMILEKDMIEKKELFKAGPDSDPESKNAYGRFLAHLVMEYENKILMKQIKYIKIITKDQTMDIPNATDCIVPTYDGMLVPSGIVFATDSSSLGSSDILQSIQDYVYAKIKIGIHGVRTKLTKKPMTDALKLPTIIPKAKLKVHVFNDYVNFVGHYNNDPDEPIKAVREEKLLEWINSTIYYNYIKNTYVYYVENREVWSEDNKQVINCYENQTKTAFMELLDNKRCNVINSKFDKDFYNEHKDDPKNSPARKDARFNEYVAHTLGEYMEYMTSHMLFKNRITNVVYSPGKEIKDTFNLFTGFPYEKLIKYEGISYTGNIEESRLFKDHMFRIICCGNVAEFEHLKTFIADIIQCPWKSRRNAHVFLSTQGAGKGTFAKFLENLIGEENYVCVDDEGRYFDKFNKMYTMKLLKVFEELSEKGNVYKNFNRLKNDITKEKELLEGKQKEMVRVNHCARYVFFTNNFIRAIHIEQNDTRFTTHVMNPERSGEEFKPWWKSYIEEEIDNREFMKAVFQYFKTMKYDEHQANMCFENEAKHIIKGYSMDNVHMMLIDFVNEKFSTLSYTMEQIKTMDKCHVDFRFTSAEVLEYARKSYGAFTSQNIRGKLQEFYGHKLCAELKLIGTMKIKNKSTTGYVLNPHLMEQCFHSNGYKNVKFTFVPRPDVDPVTGDELDDEEKEVVETTELAKNVAVNNGLTSLEPERETQITDDVSESSDSEPLETEWHTNYEANDNILTPTPTASESSGSSSTMIVNGQKIEVIDDLSRDEPITQSIQIEVQ